MLTLPEPNCINSLTQNHCAVVVELVDTLDLGSSALRVGVQVPPTAPSNKRLTKISTSNYRLKLSYIFCIEVISNPYFPAIIILITDKSIGNNPKAIAKKLNIEEKEVSETIDKIFELGLVSADEKGKISRKTKSLVTNLSEGQTSAAAKNHQKDLLDISKRSIEQTDISKRDHSAVIMTIDEKDIEEAKEAIKVFRRKFAETFQKKNTKTSKIYTLQIGLFPFEN